MSMWLSDQQKIGVAFCSGGAFFIVAGIMLFFDRSMLAMGNILSIIGLTMIIGPQKTLTFFAQKSKIKGSAAFFGGILLILMRWPLIGFCVELYGVLVLFGEWFSTIAGVLRNLPVVGPYIGIVIDKIGVTASNRELPV